MSVIPSVNASPTTLFPGLFNANSSEGLVAGSSQDVSQSNTADGQPPTFGRLFQQTTQQLTGSGQQVSDTGEPVPSLGEMNDVASAQPKAVVPASEDEDSRDVASIVFPAFVAVAAGFVERPVQGVVIDQHQVDPESDSESSEQPEDLHTVVQAAVDHPSDEVVEQVTAPPSQERSPLGSGNVPISVMSDGTVFSQATPDEQTIDSEPGSPERLPFGSKRDATSTSTSLKELRADLENQFGLQPDYRRQVSRPGLHSGTVRRLPIQNLQGTTLNADGPVVRGTSMTASSHITEAASLINDRTAVVAEATVATSEVSNQQASPLASEDAFVDRPAVPGNSRTVDQTVASDFVPVRAQPLAAELHQSSSNDPQIQSIDTKANQVSEAPATDVQPKIVVAEVDSRSQMTSAVAGGVSERDRLSKSGQSAQPQVGESVDESLIESGMTSQGSESRQRVSEFSEVSGVPSALLQRGNPEQPTLADVNGIPTGKGLAAEPDLKTKPWSTDTMQVVDADLDLLEQLLPRQTSTTSMGAAASNPVNPNSAEQLESLNLPRQIATRVLSEAEILESGDSSRFRMKLDPPELGSVMIEMQKTVLGTTITVTAADPATQQLLQDSLHNLNQTNTGESGLFDDLAFDLANGDQGHQQEHEDGHTHPRVVRVANAESPVADSDTDSEVTSEVDFVA